MNDVQLSEIDAFRAEVMANLANPDIVLEIVDVEGRSPVVVALDDEPLAALLLRVANIGGYANVFSRGAGAVRQVSVVHAESSLYEFDSDDMTVEAPSGAVTIGTFLDYVATQPHGVTIPAVLKSERWATLRDAKPVPFI